MLQVDSGFIEDSMVSTLESKLLFCFKLPFGELCVDPLLSVDSRLKVLPSLISDNEKVCSELLIDSVISSFGLSVSEGGLVGD